MQTVSDKTQDRICYLLLYFENGNGKKNKANKNNYKKEYFHLKDDISSNFFNYQRVESGRKIFLFIVPGPQDPVTSSFLCHDQESGQTSFKLDRENMKKNFGNVWLQLLKCQLNLDQYKAGRPTVLCTMHYALSGSVFSNLVDPDPYSE